MQNWEKLWLHENKDWLYKSLHEGWYEFGVVNPLSCMEFWNANKYRKCVERKTYVCNRHIFPQGHKEIYMTPYVLSFDYKCVFKGIEVIKLSSNFLYTFDQEIDFFKSWLFKWYFLLIFRSF